MDNDVGAIQDNLITLPKNKKTTLPETKITSIKNSIFETIINKDGISRRRVSRDVIRKYAIVEEEID